MGEEPPKRVILKSESGHLKDKMINLSVKAAKPHREQHFIDSVNSIYQELKPRVKSNEPRRIDKSRYSHDTQSFYLPPNATPHPYSLVLDLDETLVHYDYVLKQFRVRPFARDFLLKMSKCFEIIIFTAAQEDYANFILD